MLNIFKAASSLLTFRLMCLLFQINKLFLLFSSFIIASSNPLLEDGVFYDPNAPIAEGSRLDSEFIPVSETGSAQVIFQGSRRAVEVPEYTVATISRSRETFGKIRTNNEMQGGEVVLKQKIVAEDVQRPLTANAAEEIKVVVVATQNVRALATTTAQSIALDLHQLSSEQTNFISTVNLEGNNLSVSSTTKGWAGSQAVDTSKETEETSFDSENHVTALADQKGSSNHPVEAVTSSKYVVEKALEQVKSDKEVIPPTGEVSGSGLGNVGDAIQSKEDISSKYEVEDETVKGNSHEGGSTQTDTDKERGNEFASDIVNDGESEPILRGITIEKMDGLMATEAAAKEDVGNEKNVRLEAVIPTRTTKVGESATTIPSGQTLNKEDKNLQNRLSNFIGGIKCSLNPDDCIPLLRSTVKTSTANKLTISKLPKRMYTLPSLKRSLTTIRATLDHSFNNSLLNDTNNSQVDNSSD